MKHVGRGLAPGWARIVGGVGKGLIAAGVLILLFVVLPALGHRPARGLVAKRPQEPLQPRAQRSPVLSLDHDGADHGRRGDYRRGDYRPRPRPPRRRARQRRPFVTEIHPGDPVARLEIDKIGVDKIVVAGTDTADLRKGPGHYPNTPLPGQLGNATIAGHRTTFGAPFYRINELVVGDEIKVTTLEGVFIYRVTEQRVVSPTDVSVIANTTDAELTLTSCHPRSRRASASSSRRSSTRWPRARRRDRPRRRTTATPSKPGGPATTAGPATTDGDGATVGTTAPVRHGGRTRWPTRSPTVGSATVPRGRKRFSGHSLLVAAGGGDVAARPRVAQAVDCGRDRRVAVPRGALLLLRERGPTAAPKI